MAILIVDKETAESNFARSIDQRDEQAITVETYEETIVKGGVCWDQRNVLEFVDKAEHPASPQGQGGRVAKTGYLLTWGHLATAMTNCAKKYPNNPHVMLAVQTKIRRCKVWNAKTPSHVRKYRVEKSNRYHGGASCTFMQKFEHTVEVEQKFRLFKDKQKFTSRTLPTSGPNTYEGIYGRFLQERWPEFVQSWNQFDNLKSVRNFHVHRDTWESLKARV